MAANEYTSVGKPSQVLAWLGFGISLGVLLMIWATIGLVLILSDSGFQLASLLVLVFTIGGFFGLLGLIFSIAGLVTALRTSTQKWPSVCGIVFCCLSALSVFVPLVVASVEKSRPVEIVQPALSDENENDSHVVLYITADYKLKCYDNRTGVDSNPAVIRMSSYDKKHQLTTWMRLNDIGPDTDITIMADRGTDYSGIVEIVDVLREIGITRFRLGSDASAR